MALKHLLSRTRASHSFHLTRPSSTAATTSIPLPSPPLPSYMPYDCLAESVKSKLKTLQSPDPRFLTHNSPHPTLADHTGILSAPLTRITTLPSGLRVATESSLASRTATVGVWVDTGSRFESEGTYGIAHFLERMILKGTSRRSGRHLQLEIENMGGHLIAYTFREQTVYFAEVMNFNVEQAVDVLADILQNPKFDEAKINHQRDVILRQIEELPAEDVMFDNLHATAFQYTPLGRTILGPAENVKTITKSHLQNYLSTHYTAPRMVIVASGAVEHEDIVEQVKKNFSSLSTDPTTTSQLVAKEPTTFTGSEVRMNHDDMPLAQFVVAFNGASETDPDSIALMVMSVMLGSWNRCSGSGKHVGSELVQRVCINGIAESVTAFNCNYKDTGLFGVNALAKPDSLDDLAWAIMHEINKMCYRVSDADVTRACNKLKSSLLQHIDGTSPIAHNIGHQLLTYGRRIPFTELFARIDAVDANTVKRVANRFIYDKDIAICAMGAIKNLPDYNWFRRRTYLNRY